MLGGVDELEEMEEGLTNSSANCNQEIPRAGTGGKSVSTLVVRISSLSRGELGQGPLFSDKYYNTLGVFISFVL